MVFVLILERTLESEYKIVQSPFENTLEERLKRKRDLSGEWSSNVSVGHSGVVAWAIRAFKTVRKLQLSRRERK